MSEPINVLVTGAAGQIAYSLVPLVGSGKMFGQNQPVNLILLDIEMMKGVLEGVVMELMDCAYATLASVVATTDYAVGFKDIDVAILVGAMPRKQGMERKDLLKANVNIFKGQGEALEKYAKPDCKVVVIGNPANTNALVCNKYAPKIPDANFSALTRLDQNRAQAQIASKLGIPNSDVSNCIIWGNHSNTQFPDVSQAKATMGGAEVNVPEAVKDDSWLKGDFMTTVQKRGAAVIAARKLSSAMSAAKAISDHVNNWWFGTPSGKYVSMGVVSNGEYNIAKGLVYSFPVTITNKEVKIVEGLAVDVFAREKMELTEKELLEEKEIALSCCKDD